ncbi:MAG: amino acid racemase [Bacteroidales bacterium]|jgi:aspartate racemase
MKTIGLIGGLSWQSTIDYYRFMNMEVLKRTNGKHEAKIVIDSIDFGEVEILMRNEDFTGLTAMLVNSAQKLENAGAELLIIGANTMHFAADTVKESINIPLVNIVDATIAAIQAKGLIKVGLLGTKFTMEQDFFKQRLISSIIDVNVPGEEDREFIQQTIFKELFNATINPESKKRFLSIMDGLAREGAQGIILGCTEIPLLIKQEDTVLPVFDTTEIHALAAVELAS